MGIREADPGTEGTRLSILFQPVDRPVRGPGRVVPGDRQLGMPGLGRALGVAGILAVKRILLIPAPVAVEPALIVLSSRRFLRQEPVVSDQHEFDALKAHIGAVPVLSVVGRGFQALRRAGRLVCMEGREMRLAEKGRVVARGSQRAGKALLSDLRFQVDSVVVNAMRARQEAGQDRGAGRLADCIGRDRCGEARALPRQLVQMRRLDLSAFESNAIGALLVRGDKKDVGSCHEVPRSLRNSLDWRAARRRR